MTTISDDAVLPVERWERVHTHVADIGRGPC